jgi:hypothetical protein
MQMLNAGIVGFFHYLRLKSLFCLPDCQCACRVLAVAAEQVIESLNEIIQLTPASESSAMDSGKAEADVQHEDSVPADIHAAAENIITSLEKMLPADPIEGTESSVVEPPTLDDDDKDTLMESLCALLQSPPHRVPARVRDSIDSMFEVLGQVALLSPTTPATPASPAPKLSINVSAPTPATPAAASSAIGQAARVAVSAQKKPLSTPLRVPRTEPRRMVCGVECI